MPACGESRVQNLTDHESRNQRKSIFGGFPSEKSVWSDWRRRQKKDWICPTDRQTVSVNFYVSARIADKRDLSPVCV